MAQQTILTRTLKWVEPSGDSNVGCPLDEDDEEPPALRLRPLIDSAVAPSLT